MEPRHALESGADGLVRFELFATSKERRWSGLQAKLHRASCGRFEHRPCYLHYTVSMSVGLPVTTASSCAGVTYRGLQSAGNIDIIPLGAPYVSEEDGPSTSLIVHLTPALLESTADAMRLSPSVLSVAPHLQIRDPRLEYICWGLKSELENGDPHERLYAEGLGIAMAAQLLRRYSRLSHAMPRNGLTRRQLRVTIDLIRSHLTSDLSLGEIAAASGMSVSNFKTLFKRSMGLPVHQYVMRQRVESAVNLISRGRLRLSAAALQAGFADQSHMARCMRRILGITPTDVIRNSR